MTAKTRLYVALFLMFGAAVWWSGAAERICGVQAAGDTAPSDYCHRVDVSIQNTGGSDVTNAPVRFSFNANTLITAGQIDARAWDLLPTQGSFSNEIDVMAQDLTETAAGWWYMMPSIPAGEIRTVRMYVGNDEQRRDQGIHYSGGETVQVAHDAAMNVSDELRLSVVVDVIDDTARDEPLVEHRDTSTGDGYAIELVDAAGLFIRGWVDAITVAVAWDAAWTDIPSRFTLTYDDPDLTLFRNGVSIGTAVSGAGPINATSSALQIGDGLQDAIIREVEIVENFASTPTLVARYGFDARFLDELTAVDPTYTGTFQDYSTNNLDGTYSFNRPQSGYSVSVGALSLTSAPSVATLSDSLLSILGVPLNQDLNLYTPVPENTLSPGFSLIGGSAGDLGAPNVLYWTMIMAAIGLFLAAVSFAYMRNVAIAVAAAGLPLAYGVQNYGIPPWWIAVWIGMWVVVIGAQRWNERT